MKPRITLLTLGVDDLDKSVAFYRDGLGFNTQGIVGKEFEFGAVAFFDLAHDTALRVGPASATEFSVGHNVNSKAEVDAAMEQARKAGATIVKPAHDTFWGGYSGYFQDPDGHLWEVAWNPQWRIPE